VNVRLSKLLWILLLVVAFLALGNDHAEALEGLASWYGPGFDGLATASGEPFDPYGYTAAHKAQPLGTDLLVNCGGRSVQVAVNDRGPFVGARELDLSQEAAETIGLAQAGVDYVEYSRVDGGYGGGYPTYSETAGYSAGAAPGLLGWRDRNLRGPVRGDPVRDRPSTGDHGGGLGGGQRHSEPGLGVRWADALLLSGSPGETVSQDDARADWEPGSSVARGVCAGCKLGAQA
jgi:rare lipoprotein A